MTVEQGRCCARRLPAFICLSVAAAAAAAATIVVVVVVAVAAATGAA